MVETAFSAPINHGNIRHSAVNGSRRLGAGHANAIAVSSLSVPLPIHFDEAFRASPPEDSNDFENEVRWRLQDDL